MKKHFWKLEYSITFFAFIGVLLVFVPMKFENYIQASLITDWNDRYEKVAYMFTVIKAQTNDEILKSFAEADSPQQREKLLFQLIKPYLRMNKPDKFPRSYKPRFMNGDKIRKDSYYYFNELYFSDNQIVGVKDIVQNNDSDAWFMLMFDVNGLLPPNRWGKDIFGIYIYDEGKVVPFGYDKDLDELQASCSKESIGVDCSYYYIIGGEFHD